MKDAAVLGELNGTLQHKSQLRDVLITYEQLRKSRASGIVNNSTTHGYILHMPDGPAQRKRDRQLQQDPPSEGYPNRWADAVFQRWLFEYNPLAEAEKAWSKLLLRRWALSMHRVKSTCVSRVRPQFDLRDEGGCHAVERERHFFEGGWSATYFLSSTSHMLSAFDGSFLSFFLSFFPSRRSSLMEISMRYKYLQ